MTDIRKSDAQLQALRVQEPVGDAEAVARILTPDGKWEYKPLSKVIVHKISKRVAEMVDGMTDRQLELHCRRCGMSLSAHSYSGFGYQYPSHRKFYPIRETHRWVKA